MISVIQSCFLISLGISERGEKGMSWGVFRDAEEEGGPRGIGSPPFPPSDHFTNR